MNPITEYKALNRLAKKNGVVLMGTATMSALRFNELLRDYDLDCSVYNRSARELTAAAAIEFYRRNVEPASPATLIVCLGENEAADETASVKDFAASLAAFVADVRSRQPQLRLILSEIPALSDKAAQLNRAIRTVSRSCGVDFAALPRTEDCLTLRYFRCLKPYLFQKKLSFADAFAYAGI